MLWRDLSEKMWSENSIAEEGVVITATVYLSGVFWGFDSRNMSIFYISRDQNQ